jgi:hypothetical protein
MDPDCKSFLAHFTSERLRLAIQEIDLFEVTTKEKAVKYQNDVCQSIFGGAVRIVMATKSSSTITIIVKEVTISVRTRRPRSRGRSGARDKYGGREKVEEIPAGIAGTQSEVDLPDVLSREIWRDFC